MRHRVLALKFFVSIVKYLKILMVQPNIYSMVPSTSRYFVDGPSNQMLFITGHVSVSNIHCYNVPACWFRFFISTPCRWFFTWFTHSSHQSIKSSLHISLLSIKHHLFAQTYHNVIILIKMSTQKIYVFIFVIRVLRYVLNELYAHVNHSKCIFIHSLHLIGLAFVSHGHQEM